MRRGRLANLRTAALVAVGFVVLRVVYRVVFGGGSGDGLLLLDPPRLPLSGPFSGILLFGPVTTGGIASAALGALPFAGLILAIALLGLVVDLRALLTRGAVRGPVRTISRALVVAWSTFPALRASVARVRVARELRAERSPSSLIVPVLEQTVERAIALGASMEVRGFASSRRPEPDCERPVVLRDAGFAFEGRQILSRVSFELAPGTLTLVAGPTGSGKSTLLAAMSGLFQHLQAGEQTGTVTIAGVDRIAVPPRETAGFVGVVAQSPRLSFVAETVAEEIGFAAAIRGVSPTIVAVRVAEVADRLQIGALLDREIHELSAGEACLVAIGSALISQPVLLLVDEPLADLDAAARVRVIDVLDRLAHGGGVCVVVAEHALEAWEGVVDGRLDLRDGSASFALLGPEQPGAAGPFLGPEQRERLEGDSRSPESRRAAIATTAGAALTVRGLSVTHGSRRAVDRADLELATGEFVALVGPNGAGKSSLLHAVARPVTRDAVRVDGRDVATLHRRARRRAVALVPEAFDDLLFETTVAAECRRADRLAPAPRSRPETADTLLRLLGRASDAGQAERQGILERHPRDLSAGERLCLVIAIQLSAHPRVLLVDEPTRGLDAAARALVGSALMLAADGGAAVIVATHDRDFAERVATRTLAMADGRLDASRAEVST